MLVIGSTIVGFAIFNNLEDIPSCPVAFLIDNLSICLLTNELQTGWRIKGCVLGLFSVITCMLG
jgi:hypothetical protein